MASPTVCKSPCPKQTRLGHWPLLALILLGLVSSVSIPAFADTDTAVQAAAPETAAQKAARLEWWREARFGMFIHWGLYAEAAGYWGGSSAPNNGMSLGAGEWIMNDLRIPRTDYEQLAANFDPVQFDAEAWVKTAKEAGMKYLVITSKHHEGFCMFRTRATPYNVVEATPWHTDPLVSLSQACRKQGVKFCVYYSIMDWHSPYQLPATPGEARPAYNPTSFAPGEKAAYIQYMETELKELITQYHPGLIWFDGQWMNGWTEQDGQALYHYLRTLDPNLIVNDRVKGAGDYSTPEQYIPPNGFPGRNWETCMTMNDTWGYKKDDHHWKSTETLIHNLIDCASKGGNYLLNVGPTDLGVIPDASVSRLAEIGQWMKVNGPAVYGTTASPFAHQLPWGRCTEKTTADGTTLYLHVWSWPADGKLLVPGLQNKVVSACLLKKNVFGLHHPLEATSTADGVLLSVPDSAPDKISTTIVLKIEGTPETTSAPIPQKTDGSIVLAASDADLHGSTIQYELGSGHDNIGFWTQPEDWISWPVKLQKPGQFKVSATVAAQDSTTFDLSLDDQHLQTAVQSTGSYTSFTTVDVGTLQIPAAGQVTISVHPVKEGWQPLNLKSIELRPIADKP